ncbi:hypothetical protein K474DRAFT_1677112 [Panus rudis PR-1116 ss-1]|nr:hypothetical protein K474DRAFT_1677112 [Panus rudis PR-1116 ss-1]
MSSHNVTIEDSSPLIVYNGLWADTPSSGDLGNYTGYASPTYHTSNAAGASFELDAFLATAIYVYGTQSPEGGNFSVSLFGPSTGSTASTGLLDSSNDTTLASTTHYKVPLYVFRGLNASQEHTLQILNEGNGHFTLDSIVLENEVGTSSSKWHNVTIDDSGPAFTYWEGTWQSDSEGVVNNTQHFTTSAGSQVRIDFLGSGIEVYGTFGSGAYTTQCSGGNTHQVSRTSPGTASQASPKVQSRPQELLYTCDGLGEGPNFVLLTNTADSNSPLYVDYAVVVTTNDTNTSGLTGIPIGPPTITIGYAVPSEVNVGAVVGGVIGGVALLAAIIAGFIYYRRKQRNRKPRAFDFGDDDSIRRSSTPRTSDMMSQQPLSVITPYSVTESEVTPAPSSVPSRPCTPTASSSASRLISHQASTTHNGTSRSEKAKPLRNNSQGPVIQEEDAGAAVVTGYETLPPSYNPAWAGAGPS